MKISAVVLAAGSASRMGQNKLLLEWAGEPLVRRVVRAACEQDFSEVIVVVGYEADRVADALKALPCRVIRNDHWDRGMAGSIVSGIHAASKVADAYLILLGDMPWVSPELLQAVAAQAGHDRIVVPRHGSREGNPVAFGSAFYDRLLALRGDEGARSLIELNRHRAVYVEWSSENDFEDVDTPEDLLR